MGEGARPDLIERPCYELPYLAQDSGDESRASSMGYIEREATENWTAINEGYSHSTIESEETCSVATFLSSLIVNSGRPVLQIVQPTASLESSTSSGTESGYQWRSIPIPPPEDRTDDSVTTASVPELTPRSETESVLSPMQYIYEGASSRQDSAIEAGSMVSQGIPFMVDIQMEMDIVLQEGTAGAEDRAQRRPALETLRGRLQGTAMSPLLYTASMQLLSQDDDGTIEFESSQTESDISTSPSLPALHEIRHTTQQQYSNINLSQDYNTAYNGAGSANEERIRYDAHPSGDTVASTSSYLSEIEIIPISTNG